MLQLETGAGCNFTSADSQSTLLKSLLECCFLNKKIKLTLFYYPEIAALLLRPSE